MTKSAVNQSVLVRWIRESLLKMGLRWWRGRHANWSCLVE